MSAIEMPYCYHRSLRGLPNTQVDQFGNLNVNGTRSSHSGLRHHYDYLMQIELEALRDRQLDQLLNWIRWGAETEVVWECTLPELVALIERWEQVNELPELYGMPPEDTRVSWISLWKQAKKYGVFTHHFCRRCNRRTNTARHCSHCYTWGETFPFTTGPRGPETYNLELEWNDGHAVANAAYHTRGKKRSIPAHL